MVSGQSFSARTAMSQGGITAAMRAKRLHCAAVSVSLLKK
jgi:hypothetical protein